MAVASVIGLSSTAIIGDIGVSSSSIIISPDGLSDASSSIGDTNILIVTTPTGVEEEAFISSTHPTGAANILISTDEGTTFVSPTHPTGDANILISIDEEESTLSRQVNPYVRKPGTVIHQTVVLSTNTVFFNDFGVVEFVGGAITTPGITEPAPRALSGEVFNTMVFRPSYYNVSTEVAPRIIDSFAGVTNNEVLAEPSNREVLFGVITSDKKLAVKVLNKRLDTITLVDAVIDPLYGCEVSGIYVGSTIPSNTYTTFYITAKLMLGESAISGWVPITFDKVVLWIYISVLRQPIIVYSLHPDRESYAETYSFKTNIFQSTTKREKRVSLMKRPKRKVKYSVTTTDSVQALQIINNLLVGMNGIMYQPLWAFASKATSYVYQSIIVPCDTYYDIFKVGEYCGLYMDEYTVLLVEIVGVAANAIEVKNPVTLEAGSYVVPLIVGTPEASQSRSYSNSVNSKVNVGVLEL